MAGNEDLHRKFQALLMFLTLVCAINSGGSPVLTVFADALRPYTAALKVRPVRNRLLNAITALLVRNHEIVATTVDKSYHILALQQAQPDIPEQEADPEQEANTDTEEITLAAARSNEIGKCLPTKIFTIKNPRDDDNFTFNNYLLRPKGVSHKDHLERWDQLFAIA